MRVFIASKTYGDMWCRLFFLLTQYNVWHMRTHTLAKKYKFYDIPIHNYLHIRTYTYTIFIYAFVHNKEMCALLATEYVLRIFLILCEIPALKTVQSTAYYIPIKLHIYTYLLRQMC